jgi:hypothetical protein
MTNVVMLNNVDHHDLRVIGTPGAAWGEGVDQIAVLPTEYEAAQRDYPLLLRRDGAGAFEAVALLGLDPGENLFLDGGRWSGGYVPALLARGPFSIGLHDRGGGDSEAMIHVDLDDPRVGREGGEPLFLSHGGNAPALIRLSEVLRTVYEGHEGQAAMFAAFEAAGLIEPVRLEITLDETLRYDLLDYHTIGTAPLSALTGAALEGLHRQGFLAAAIHLASSLGNVERLIARKNQRRGAAAAT